MRTKLPSNSLLWLVAAFVGGAGANLALAADRESVTFTNVNSDGEYESPVNTIKSALFSGTYNVRQIRMTGVLLPVNAESYADEAIIEVKPPGGEWIEIFWSSVQEFPGTVMADGDEPLRLPEVAPASGVWEFRFSEAYDDAGIDARWNSVTFTLDDGTSPPPAAIDWGKLSDEGLNPPPLPLESEQVLWYTFEIGADVSSVAGRYLEISTAGSSLPADADWGEYPNDTSIALYNAQGHLVASNDDGFPDEFTSLLSFGAGGPLGAGGDGDLPAGRYYLAVSAFADAWAGNFFVEPLSWQAGTIRLAVRTNAGGCEPPKLIQVPVDLAVEQGSTAVFAVEAVHADGLTYQWRFNGRDLADDPGRIRGALSSALEISNARSTDEGEYSVVVRGECDVVASARLSVRCLVDFNEDGFVNGSDFDEFVGAFERGDASADYNRDDFVNGSDFDDFVWAFENSPCTRCPDAPFVDMLSVIDHRTVLVTWSNLSPHAATNEIEISTNGTSYAVVAVVPASGSPQALSDLVPDRDYWVRMRACSALCCSEPSQALQFRTPVLPPVPGKPSGLHVSDVWDTTIDLHWNDNSDNEDEFIVERLAAGDWIELGRAARNAQVKRIDSGLSPSTDYTLRVRAANAGGSSASGTLKLRTGPARPVNIRVTDISATDAIVRWDDVSSDESKFVIWLDRWSGAEWVREQTIDNEANDQGRHLSPPSLTPSARYRATVRAHRGDGSRSGISGWAEFVADSGLPAAPSNLRAANIWARTIEVNYDDNSNNETQFRVAISTDNVNWSGETVELSDDTAARIENLQPRTRYYVKVRAANSYGYSAYSNTLTVDTRDEVPGAPSGLFADNVHRNSVDLKWSDNANNETAYHIAISTDGANWNNWGGNLAAGLETGSYSKRVTGLTPNTNYWFKVRCSNAEGYSAYSNIIQVRTKP